MTRIYEFAGCLRVPAESERAARERARALADAVSHGEATLALGDPEPCVERNGDRPLPARPTARSHGRERFCLDRERLASHLIASSGEPFGIDSGEERGFAAAVSTRFDDAKRAGAILGPAALEVMVYAINPHGLIVAVREAEPHLGPSPSLRQVATYSFDAEEVACYGDERFQECCAAIGELLDRANELLPSFEALRAAG